MSDASREFLEGGGEMGALTRAHEWASTPVGPVEGWPQSLRTALGILLNSRHPMFLWWGPDLVQFYNDGYRPSLGDDRHPSALGARGREFWVDIWPAIGPDIEAVMTRGASTWHEDRLVPIVRNGRLQEVYWTYGYSPVRDDDGRVGGTLVVVQEQTARILGQRRLRTLRDLAARGSQSQTETEAWSRALTALAGNPEDVPWAVLYAVDNAGGNPRLVGQTLEGAASGGPSTIGDDDERGAWPLRRVLESGQPLLVTDVRERFGDLVGSAWPEPVSAAWLAPVRGSSAASPSGVLVAGISPRLSFDADYREFLVLAADQIATAVAGARIHEDERRQADALAELDRAKTSFFSNVSHEFRTPLTLLLGPLEESLEAATDPAERERLRLAHRNALRLQKLVNVLLDFSRVEAGRVQASFEPTDLARLTADLAGSFRSASERAGLRLIVHCDPLPEPVYVDRDMWEKIVLNLLSNAVKFTFEGEITVTIEGSPTAATLTVRDTGTGIDAQDLPRIFDRFYRVERAPARTHEGTGIGLALVQELVKLHGGTISVESAPAAGTTFTVSVPMGTAHLAADRIAASPSPTRAGSRARDVVEVHDARSSRLPPPPAPSTQAGSRARVLLADDNADMRQYLSTLLGTKFDVETVTDGEAALAAIRRQPPDLIVTDVMMPNVDGFELVRRLRADDRMRTIPVLLLTARAGEDARVEGLEGGADDYMIKPFSSRELLARVGALVELSLMRRRVAEARREQALEAERTARAEAERVNRMKDEFLATLSHELRSPLNAIVGWTELLTDDALNPDDTRRALRSIARHARAQTRMIEELLDMNRITTGRIELNAERLILAESVEQSVQSVAPTADAKSVRVLTAIEPGSGRILGDPDRLRQVFSNLLGNAVKFTPPGGQIRVTVDQSGDSVIVSITDTGEGIDPAFMPHLFNRFSQADARMTRAQPGLGLGLSIVKGLVELHGGTVTARSPGRGLGATFTVTLPLAADAAPSPESLQRDGRPERSPLPGLAGVRILVVDDDADAREPIERILTRAGATVATAASAEQARDIMRRERFDLLLSDIGMPVEDGYDLIRWIRALPPSQGRDLQAVALTAYAHAVDRRLALQAGFQGHLAKPVGQAELLTVCASLTRRS